LLGLPASTFDGFLPALLPLFFRALGAGFFTLPLMLSIFVLRAIVPLLFIPLGRIFGFGKKSSILLGLIFVLNPILFKFFNRYYEFAGWLFFVLWFAFFYKFLEAKQFNRLLFAASVASASLLVLSHTAPLFFLAIAALFLIRSKRDLERAITVGLLTAGLTAFWLLPFFSYQQLSMVSVQSGMELQSLGIQAAGFLLLLLLFFSTFIFHNVRV
jgi:hypothetical protein